MQETVPSSRGSTEKGKLHRGVACAREPASTERQCERVERMSKARMGDVYTCPGGLVRFECNFDTPTWLTHFAAAARNDLEFRTASDKLV